MLERLMLVFIVTPALMVSMISDPPPLTLIGAARRILESA
jgi:hypothetical protein